MSLFSVFGNVLRWVAGALGDQITGAVTAVVDTIGNIVRSLSYPLERVFLQPVSAT